MCRELRQRNVPVSPLLSGRRFSSDGSGSGWRFVASRRAVLVSPLAWRNSICTGPTPRTHQTVRTPVPNGSPSAPACETSERTTAASMPCGNAGTVTRWRPS
jgi:hypothetical protein